MSPGSPASAFGRRVLVAASCLLAAASCLLAVAALGCAGVPSGDSAGSTAPTLSPSTAVTTAAPTASTAAPTTTVRVSTTTATTVAATTSISVSTTTSRLPPDRHPAPGFRGTTLSGAEVSLESYAGKPLVLVFWWSG